MTRYEAGPIVAYEIAVLVVMFGIVSAAFEIAGLARICAEFHGNGMLAADAARDVRSPHSVDGQGRLMRQRPHEH